MENDVVHLIIRIGKDNREIKQIKSQKFFIKKLKFKLKRCYELNNFLKDDEFLGIYNNVEKLCIYKYINNKKTEADYIIMENGGDILKKLIDKIDIKNINIDKIINLIDMNYEQITELFSTENNNDLIFIYNGKDSEKGIPYILFYRQGAYDKLQEYKIEDKLEKNDTLLFLMILVYLAKKYEGVSLT